MNKKHLVLNEKHAKLVFSPESNHIYEEFVFEWLNSWRNTSFLPWKTYTAGSKKNIFAELDKYKSLTKMISSLSSNDVLKLIIDLVQTISKLRNTILLESNMLFDTDYIFIQKHKNRLSIKYVYLPINKSLSKETKRLESNLYIYLVNLYIQKVNKRHKANKELEQKLLFAAENNPEELLGFVQSLLPKHNLTTILSKFDITSKVAKIWTKFKSLWQPQYITLVVLTVLLIALYFSQANSQEISKGISLAILLLIILGIFLEAFLLFNKHSPYKVLKPSVAKSPNIKAEKSETDANSLLSSNIELHPYLTNRIASLDLLNNDSNLKEKHWVIMNSEFIIGTNPKTADLLLGLKTSDEIILRIFQRAGTFYLETLSKEIIIKLQGRMIFCYQEYELANAFNIEIGKYYFEFHSE